MTRSLVMRTSSFGESSNSRLMTRGRVQEPLARQESGTAESAARTEAATGEMLRIGAAPLVEAA